MALFYKFISQKQLSNSFMGLQTLFFGGSFWELSKTGKGGRKCGKNHTKDAAKNVCFLNDKKDITIVFDSVSRMSRDAEEGFELYKDLYNRGVRLVFLKEPHINTDTYKEQLNKQIQIDARLGDEATTKLMNSITDALNTYMMDMAEKQIKLAFEQSEKEVADLRKRTSEGLITAKLNGKQVGRVQGKKYESKKAKLAKERIRKISKTFEGNLADTECIEMLNISRNSFYKYKAELKEEIS